jgi:hypothetical protein
LRRAPFGVDDLVGNAFELTAGILGDAEVVARGGAYYYDAATAPIPNRSAVQPDLRDPTMGLRLCADLR